MSKFGFSGQHFDFSRQIFPFKVKKKTLGGRFILGTVTDGLFCKLSLIFLFSWNKALIILSTHFEASIQIDIQAVAGQELA